MTLPNWLLSQPTAVEYAVMLALISVVRIAAITLLGTNARNTFGDVALNTAAGGSQFAGIPSGSKARRSNAGFARQRRTVSQDQVERDQTMGKLGQFTLDFLKNEDGPTAVEYAVMLALIIVVCITAISALGSTTSNTFTYAANKVATTSS